MKPVTSTDEAPPEVLIRLYDRQVTVFLDQDGPLADFEAAAHAQGLHPKEAKMKRGFYENLRPTAGAIEAVRELCAMAHVQVFIATKIPNHNPYAATEKLLWIARHLPELEERVIITPNKACIGRPGDYLVDDRAHKADASFFSGTFIHFLSPSFPNWDVTMKHLRQVLNPSLSAHEKLSPTKQRGVPNLRGHP